MEIQGFGLPLYYRDDSNIVSVAIGERQVDVVDELPEPEDDRDLVLIEERRYLACEGVNYRNFGFCKLGDTWVYPEENPAPRSPFSFSEG